MNNTFSKQLNGAEFSKISNFVYSNFRAIMPANKKDLQRHRLMGRLREINIYSFNDYCDYLFSDRSEDREVMRIIDFIK